jgi:hypothetical protein
MGENFFKNNIEIRFNSGKKIIKVTFIKGQKRQGPYRIKSVLLENKKISPPDSGYIIKKEALRKLRKKEINIKIYLA